MLVMPPTKRVELWVDVVVEIVVVAVNRGWCKKSQGPLFSVDFSTRS